MVDESPVAEVDQDEDQLRALFERYERALAEKDIAVLDASFWNSPHTIRYAIHEQAYGFSAIHALRG